MWKRDLRRYGLDELRRLLYGLHAILRLHTLQEEESYLSLGDQPEDAGQHEDAARNAAPDAHRTAIGPRDQPVS